INHITVRKGKGAKANYSITPWGNGGHNDLWGIKHPSVNVNPQYKRIYWDRIWICDLYAHIVLWIIAKRPALRTNSGYRNIYGIGHGKQEIVHCHVRGCP